MTIKPVWSSEEIIWPQTWRWRNEQVLEQNISRYCGQDSQWSFWQCCKVSPPWITESKRRLCLLALSMAMHASHLHNLIELPKVWFRNAFFNLKDLYHQQHEAMSRWLPPLASFQWRIQPYLFPQQRTLTSILQLNCDTDMINCHTVYDLCRHGITVKPRSQHLLY